MWRQRRGRIVLWLAGGLSLGLALNTHAQTPLATSRTQTPNPAPQAKPPTAAPAPAVTTEQAILLTLRANPVTAPYGFQVIRRNGRYVLRGRVGTKQIHDAAVQTVLALGYPMVDELVIDTAEAYRAAAAPAPGPVVPRSAALSAWAGLAGPIAGAAGPLVGSPYGLSTFIYPPPLFGRYDDPFFGLQPPLISYPPWWRSISYRAAAEAASESGTAPASTPDPAAAPPGSAQPGAPAPAAQPASPGAQPPDGTVEMTIDPRGVAVIRGTVPTLADRIAVGQRLAQTPGIIEVQNLLNVKETGTEGTPVAQGGNRDVPPPPPRPEPPGGPPAAPAPAAAPAQPPRSPSTPPPRTSRRNNGIVVDETDLSQRIARAMEKRPALAGQPVHVSVREGVAHLSGRLPTAYEAMVAYRVAQQTPGVREVIDRLEFVVPDAESKNPLLVKGRPEDVEPYLEAQVKRQLGDLAHVDRVRVQGDRFEIQGTVTRTDDLPRVEAILHSMPLLRGYRTEIRFQPE